MKIINHQTTTTINNNMIKIYFSYSKLTKKTYPSWFKTILTGFCLLLIANVSYGQILALDWVKTVNGTSNTHLGRYITVDNLGNTYSVGYFGGTMDFDPGAGVAYLTGGYSSAFIQKLDAQGDFVWAKAITGTVATDIKSIAIDDWGNVYTTGGFRGTADFDPGVGVYNLTSFSSAEDIFIQKLDAQGNFVWAKRMGAASYEDGYSIAVDKSGNVYTTGNYQWQVDFDPGVGQAYLTSVASSKDIFLQKLDPQGNFLWAKSIGGADYENGKYVTTDEFNNVYLTGVFKDSVDFNPNTGTHYLVSEGLFDVFVLKLDSSGAFGWAKSFGGPAGDEGNALTVDSVGNVYTTGKMLSHNVDLDPGVGTHYIGGSNIGYMTFIQKLDAQGNFIWGKSIEGHNSIIGMSIQLDKKGNLCTAGSFYNHDSVDFNPNAGTHYLTTTGLWGYDIFIQCLNPQGDFLWADHVGVNCNSTHATTDEDGNLYVLGDFQYTVDFNPNGYSYPVTSQTQGLFTHKLSKQNIVGKVYHDLDQDCTLDSNEIGIPGRVLTLNPGNIIITSNQDGTWSLGSLPVGNYTISVDTTGYWTAPCPPIQNFTVTTSDSITNVAPLGLFSTRPCPMPDVSIQALSLRPGFLDQKIYVQVCNQFIGTGEIDSAYILVELDSLMEVQSATLPYDSLGNNQYRVYINDLQPGDCTSFYFLFKLDSTAILGQTLCINGLLYPIDSCALDTIPAPYPAGSVNSCNSPWDQSSLAITAACLNDSIQFVISNNGLSGIGDMTCFAPMRLYVDGQLITSDSVQLNGGDSAVFVFGGDGRTWRMEVDQHPLHPGNSNPNATIELCGDASNWTSDLVNNFPSDDADPMIDIYCAPVRGSYDPNNKLGFPFGVGNEHNIVANQEMEYTINFQNTGTDTAFTVVIRDTLTADLDISTIRVGVSSHSYSFKMYGPRVLEWTFNNIMLPDSNVNESASHGFVKFKVNQVPNLPAGTIIENSAAIYFDYNLPIITNTSWHTIHENVLTINVDKIMTEELEVKIYPNPSSGIVHIEHREDSELQLLVIDNLGRVLMSKRIQSNLTEINMQKFPSGVYFFRMDNGRESRVQKVIKQ